MDADALFDIVIPTIGRPSLARLLESLARGPGPLPGTIFLVDDRSDKRSPISQQEFPASLAGRIRVLSGRAAGPAAARNIGWRASQSPWIAFLDDDVVVYAHWRTRLAAELEHLPTRIGGTQGRVRVPLSADRRPTDWERNIKGLEQARWATADMAYRRAVLEAVGGFDERFPRAFREDADLALRVMARGYSLTQGRRGVLHPVRPADAWVSVRLQAGNADDALMRALHGKHWHTAGAASKGRRSRHFVITAAGVVALMSFALRVPRLICAPGLVWLAGTAEFAWARIRPGPRTAREVGVMLLTSVLIPPAATYHWLRGTAGTGKRHGRALTVPSKTRRRWGP